MAFDASGTFTRLRGNDSWKGDAAAGTKIKSDLHDSNDNDIANGLSECITKTGKSQPSVDIPWNGKKITNLAPGIAPTDAVNVEQLQSVRTFSTGIVISGSASNGWITYNGIGTLGQSYTQADMFFGVQEIGNPATPIPAPTTNRFIWNDKADATGNNMMVLHDSGELDLLWKNEGAGSGPFLNLIRDSASPATSDYLANIIFSGKDSSAADVEYARIYGYIEDPVNASEDGGVGIMSMTAGSLVDRAYFGSTLAIIYNDLRLETGRLKSPGPLLLSATSGSIYLRPNGIDNGSGETVLDTNGSLAAWGYRCRSGITGSFYGNNFNLGYTGGSTVQIWIDSTNFGNVTFSSDYRIKKDVTDLPSAWDKVKALRPISYTQAEFSPPSATVDGKAPDEPMFKADDHERWGFIAHELQENFLPTAANGVKDAPDEIQSVNLAPVVAALTKALQEAMARIEVLEAKP